MGEGVAFVADPESVCEERILGCNLSRRLIGGFHLGRCGFGHLLVAFLGGSSCRGFSLFLREYAEGKNENIDGCQGFDSLEAFPFSIVQYSQ